MSLLELGICVLLILSPFLCFYLGSVYFCCWVLHGLISVRVFSCDRGKRFDLVLVWDEYIEGIRFVVWTFEKCLLLLEFAELDFFSCYRCFDQFYVYFAWLECLKLS